MKKSKSALVILGFAAAAVCVQAAAQDSGVYLGGLIGTATSSDGCSGASLPCGRSDTSWGVQAGYQFSRSFGAEIGYRNLGKISHQSGGGMHAEVKSALGEALLVAGLPIERLTVYGKGGIYHARSDLRSDFLIEGRNRNTGWTAGAGVSYDITRYLAVRLEYQKYNNLGGDAIGFRTDVGVSSLGATLRF